MVPSTEAGNGRRRHPRGKGEFCLVPHDFVVWSGVQPLMGRRINGVLGLDGHWRLRS